MKTGGRKKEKTENKTYHEQTFPGVCSDDVVVEYLRTKNESDLVSSQYTSGESLLLSSPLCRRAANFFSAFPFPLLKHIHSLQFLNRFLFVFNAFLVYIFLASS